jgi:hypothetical protein
MSNFNICSICKEYDWEHTHTCPDIYYFKHEDWGDEFNEIRARSFRDAAYRFAQKYNEDGDYALMDSSERVIISDGKREQEFIVSAEQDISYSVEEVV